MTNYEKIAYANQAGNLLVHASKDITDAALLLAEGELDVGPAIVESVYYLTRTLSDINKQMSELAKNE